MTRNELKSKLALLGKRNIDVILAMKENGVSVSQQQFSRAFSEVAGEPKQKLIREEAARIVAGWEARSNGKMV